MRLLPIWLGLAVAIFGTVALADDAADCTAGIDMIRSEIAKNPPAEVLEKLNKLLTDAEREAQEQEFEECFEAIEDAREAVAG
jgi:hypothetical protein